MKDFLKLAMTVLICGFTLQTSTERLKPKVEAFYVPFGVDTFIATTSESIEARHNITSLIEGKVDRFQKVLESGEESDEFHKEYVRLKLKVGGKVTLVDQGYHILHSDGSISVLDQEGKEALFLLFIECIPSVSPVQ